MYAILAIIAAGGRAIIVIYREAVEINFFSFNLLFNTTNHLKVTLSNPFRRGARGWVHSSKNKTMPLEGKTAPSW